MDRLDRLTRQRCSLLSPVRSLWRALLRIGLFNPRTALGGIVKSIHTPFDAFERTSEAAANGNLMVFREIGFEFARYLDSCPAGVAVDSPEFAGFLAGLRTGPPPDGQDLLRAAFTAYQRQQSEPDPDRRAELQYLANLEIGLHEQTRLQAEIRKAMEAGPDTAVDLFVFYRPYHRFARDLTRRVISECLMELALPETVLSLGRHLAHPFPAALRNVTVPDLQQLLETIEPPGQCRDCGVDDWADLKQRMHYIAHVFRAFHLDDSLFSPPLLPDAEGCKDAV